MKLPVVIMAGGEGVRLHPFTKILPKPLMPIGFELFAILRTFFKPVDIVAVVRHNKNLQRGNWHAAAVDGNYFLRGFNYLFIMKKEDAR